MINNTTIHERIFENYSYNFTTSKVSYMSIHDINSIDTLITFYSGCLNFYPYIFIPAIVLGLWIGYTLTQKYIGSDKT
jgi:hypothetical protein